jgi:hypothetical protein
MVAQTAAKARVLAGCGSHTREADSPTEEEGFEPPGPSSVFSRELRCQEVETGQFEPLFL